MTKIEIDKLIEEGVCSSEEINTAKKLSENLDSPEFRDRIILSEHFLKAIADRNRIKILLLLEQGEMCVCQLTAVTDAPQPTVSNMLRTLEMASIIKREKRGRWHYYSLMENKFVSSLMEEIRNV